MRDLVNPIQDLFDAAARHLNVRLTCPVCGHSAVLSAPALWWRFERMGWQDRLREVPRRCRCLHCAFRRGRDVPRPKLELVADDPTDARLPLPSELDWRRELRRRR